MRSGFLNASSPESPAPSLDKGSRNKRKFRTDQQQQCAAASPLPTPVCDDGGESSKNVMNVSETCSSGAMDPRSLNGADTAAVSPDTITGQHMMLSDHLNPPSNYPTLGNVPLPHYSLHATDFPSGFHRLPYSKDGQESGESPQDSDWDRFLEAQLEEILMNMLDVVYKDAVKKITFCNFSQEEALNAVLRNGRWNGRDALSSIVEGSLAWLHNSEARGSSAELVFSAVKQMENFVLAEMICTLRKVRPYLSKGEAMWCLLMCDLNVVLACTMEEDAMPSSLKDGSESTLVPSQSKGSSDLPLPNVPPTSAVSAVPLPEKTPQVPQANAQPSNLLLSSHKDSHSAFSTPSFSSSLVGKVAVTCCKGISAKTFISKTAQTPTTFANSEAVSSTQEQGIQNAGAPNSYQLSSSQIPALEEHATKLGLYTSQCNNGPQHLDKCHNWKSEHLASNGSMSDASPVHSREMQMVQVASSQCMPQCSDIMARSSLLGQSTALQPDFIDTKLKGGKNISPAVQLPSDSKQPVQTDLQIGSTSTFPGFQLSPSEAWMSSNASSNVSTLASSGAELSLASAALVGSACTEISGDSQINSCKHEMSVNYTNHGVSVSQILGCIDSNAEERKTVMLWQLVDRVKYLEAQLQEWTDWAQQKVMQAARRLTKDTAELKALRQERDEYMRLKKEKQALEESTMKKLAEMDNALRKALSQVDRANLTALRLEAENAEVRAAMEAAKLTAAKSVTVCQEATKRENKSTKKSQGWEKQKLKLKDDLIEGKRSLSHLLEQLSQARERHQQAEVRWRQVKKVKEEALLHAETVKRAKEQVANSAKRREETLQRKSETESQRCCDEVQKLQSEIARVKSSLGLQPSILSWGNGFGMASSNWDTCSAEKLKQINARLLSEIADLQQSQRDIHGDRECVMCMSEEMSVVFLPCAHQVVCVKCNELQQREGLRDCPSCRTRIQQRIQVYGVRS